MRRTYLDLVSAFAGAGLLATAGCSSGGDPQSLGPVPTAPSTTVGPTTAPSTTSTTVAVTASSTTRPPTTVAAATVVATGTSPAGDTWQLVAEPGGRAGLVCAFVRGPFPPRGRVCNEATEQDFNGDDTLRYSGAAGDGTFVIGVSRPNVSRVRAELRGGAVVERNTVAAAFTAAARFVALPIGADAVLRSLTALDSGGAVLTKFVINP